MLEFTACKRRPKTRLSRQFIVSPGASGVAVHLMDALV